MHNTRSERTVGRRSVGRLIKGFAMQECPCRAAAPRPRSPSPNNATLHLKPKTPNAKGGRTDGRTEPRTYGAMQPFFWASGVQRPRCGEKGTWQKVDAQKGCENSQLNVVDFNVGSVMIINSQLLPIALENSLFVVSLVHVVRPLTFIPFRNRVEKRTDI